MKKNLVKKLTVLVIIAILAMGQSFSALAAEPVYTYKAKYDSDGISTLTRKITGTMTGPRNILKLAVYGVYSLRGSGRYLGSGMEVESNTLGAQIEATAIDKGQAGDSKYYYAALCCGYYRANTTTFWKVVAAKDVAFSN